MEERLLKGGWNAEGMASEGSRGVGRARRKEDYRELTERMG